MTVALIDAENVRRSRWPNPSGDELLERAREWADRESVHAWVIFDGRTPDGTVGEQEFGGGDKAVGTGSESADDWIIRQAREFLSRNQPYWLVTSDRELRRLAGDGATRVLGGGRFLGDLGASRASDS